MIPSREHNGSQHSSDTEENSSNFELDGLSSYSDSILEVLSDSMEHLDKFSGSGGACSTEALFTPEPCILKQALTANGKSLNNNSLRSNSCDDTVSSVMSIDTELISSDEQEEYLIYKEARRQKKRARIAHQLELEGYEDRDEINFCYLTLGDAAVKGKSSTMISSAGTEAFIDTRMIIIPASEMLRNYFRSMESTSASKSNKENLNICKNMDDSVSEKAIRNALSEKKLTDLKY